MINRVKTTHIILHHSLSPDGLKRDWQGIKEYHLANGWEDVAYHYGIELVYNSYVVQLGRSELTVGAHCKEGSMNNVSLGICFVGNFDKDKVPKEQWETGIKLVKELMIKYKIPAVNVKGHGEIMRDFKASYIKSCPGYWFDCSKFRKELIK